MDSVDWGRLVGQTLMLILIAYAIFAVFLIKPLRKHKNIAAAIALVATALLTYQVGTNIADLKTPWLGWIVAAAFIIWRVSREPKSAVLSSASPHIAETSELPTTANTSRESRTRQPNVFVKHWRGDLSLPISYWVIGSLLTLVVIAIATAIGSSGVWNEIGPRASGAAILSFYCLVIPLTVWQVVGIWRSADKHTQRGGKAFWAGLAKVSVLLGLLRSGVDLQKEGVPLMITSAKLLFGSDNIPPYAIRLLRNDTELELSGGMPFGTSDAVKKFLDAAPAIEVIHLNNQGGLIAEAHRLYKTIQERNLITYTSTECVSACAIAFLAGRERYLAESGRLGFHGVSFGELGEETIGGLNDEVRHTLAKHGVPKSFVDRALSASSKEMWYPSNDELTRANVINSVVDSRYFGLSGVSQWRDAHEIELGLLAIPIYSALAQHDQENYVRLRRVMVSGVQNGQSANQIQSELRAILVEQIIPRLLKIAPDEALIRYWRSQIAEMEYLAKQNPKYCADFAFPEFAASQLDLSRMLTKDLVAEDADALVAVVESAATHPMGHEPTPRIEADLQAVIDRVGKDYPGALEVIASPAKFKDEPNALCLGVLAFYSEVLAIPSSGRTGALLRYLASN